MRRRLERRIEALRDGALSERQARRLRDLLRRRPEAARIVAQTESLGRAVREAHDDPPCGPDPEALILRLRSGLRQIDRELAELPAWRRALERVSERMRPALLAGAAAAALLLIFSIPPLIPVGEGVAQARTTVRSLRQLQTPVVVLEGGEGVTIIWVLEAENPDLSVYPGGEGWA